MAHLYTIRQQLTDGTLDDPIGSFTTKKLAISTAKKFAKTAAPDVNAVMVYQVSDTGDWLEHEIKTNNTMVL